VVLPGDWGRLDSRTPNKMKIAGMNLALGGARVVTHVPRLLNVSLVVLTFNEEINLEGCLQSAEGVCHETFVVDSGSTDKTLEIARRYGRVEQHPFETHARQWKWAIENLPLSSDWVLALDADQRLTPELKAELEHLFSRGTIPDDVDGLYVNRRQIFKGRWIRHGGYYPKYLLKLFRVSKVQLDQADLVDHHFYVPGRTLKLRHDLVEENQKENTISFWIQKHNHYAQLLAREELERRNTARRFIRPFPFGSPDQRVLWRKNLWCRGPIYIRPWLYFVYRYFLRLGFMDGKQGFVFHFLQAFWFRLLVDINIEELRDSVAHSTSSARSRSQRVPR
jgi:glycosyltransferase involved in cell wall biosynthesis